MRRGGTVLIKLGALGDVIRTTPLVRRLPRPVVWVTRAGAMPLLRGDPSIARIVDIARARALLRGSYELVVNFDEEPRACALAARLKARRKVGARLEGGTVVYCRASAPWFDASLVSRLGRRQADRLKTRGRSSYQSRLFAACGLRFTGEEYRLPVKPRAGRRGLVGLEARVGPRWPGKAWGGFAALAAALRREGYHVRRLRQRRTLARYLEDINDCAAVVCGDTLALHAALGLKKPVAALFTCTSPHEIHGYGRAVKLVDPQWRRHLFSRRPVDGWERRLPVAAVLKAVRRLAGPPA